MRFQSSKTLALLCAIIVIWLGRAQATVVINEAESNPAGDESAFKTSVTAWFELYNNDDKDVDISGWSIKNSEGRSITLPQSTVIRGLDYYAGCQARVAGPDRRDSGADRFRRSRGG
jgi:hypothetical protein